MLSLCVLLVSSLQAAETTGDASVLGLIDSFSRDYVNFLEAERWQQGVKEFMQHSRDPIFYRNKLKELPWQAANDQSYYEKLAQDMAASGIKIKKEKSNAISFSEKGMSWRFSLNNGKERGFFVNGKKIDVDMTQYKSAQEYFAAQASFLESLGQKRSAEFDLFPISDAHAEIYVVLGGMAIMALIMLPIFGLVWKYVKDKYNSEELARLKERLGILEQKAAKLPKKDAQKLWQKWKINACKDSLEDPACLQEKIEELQKRVHDHLAKEDFDANKTSDEIDAYVAGMVVLKEENRQPKEASETQMLPAPMPTSMGGQAK